MRKILLTLFLTVIGTAAFAEGDSNRYYWVAFKDKMGTPYKIEQPNEFLSQRALFRRQRLHIAIDSTDLPVNPNYVEQVRNQGAKIHNVSKWLNGTTVIADDKTADRIKKLDFVEDVIYYSSRAANADSKRDSYDSGSQQERLAYSDLHDTNYYNLGFSQIAQLNGQTLHKHGFEGQGILVGVCDGGFPGVDTLANFASLRDENRIIATRDFVAHRPSVYLANEHGTMVLSTLASNVPGVYVGTAPKATYALCITEDTHTESPIEELNWVSAAEYLDSLGVDVINSSLGYLGFDEKELNHTFTTLDGHTAHMSIGAEIAATRGILCVNSAGNEGKNGASSISVPADAEHVLSVGAVWANGNIAGFSSYGSTFDNRVKPDVCAQGVWVYVSSPTGGFTRANGTSFSSPIMAGMMACLRQAVPQASVDDLCRAIRMSSSLADRVNNRYGYGIPDMQKALTLLRGNRQFAHGKPFPPHQRPELSRQRQQGDDGVQDNDRQKLKNKKELVKKKKLKKGRQNK